MTGANDDAHAERRAFRAGRVRLAFLTSGGSKALGLIVQFLAVPLAVRALGAERFGIYTMLVSALVWIDLGRLGIGPGLTRELALAWNRGQREREHVLFSSAMAFVLVAALAIALMLGVGLKFAGPHIEAVFGTSAAQFRGEILWGIFIVGGFLVAQIVFSVGEAARSAYQDDFVNNIANMAGNGASLLLIFGVALFWPTVPAFALAVFGSIVLAKGVNLAALLLSSRAYLRPRWRLVDRTSLRLLLGSSLAFWVIQIATLMMHNLSLVQLGQMVGATQLTPFAVVFRLLQIFSTIVLMISMPLWPAITDAAVRGDHSWISRSARRLVLAAMAFSMVTALALTLLGSSLIPLWAGPDVSPDMVTNLALGVYFVIWMWSHCHATILFGLGRLWPVAFATLVEGTLVLILSGLLVPRLGALGTAIGLCAAGAATTAWILPLFVRRALAQPLQVERASQPSARQIQSALSEEPTV